MNEKTTNYTGGVSAASLLGVAFVTLKLCNIIDWSWWWVTAPFWAPAILFIVLLAAVLLVPLFVAGMYMLTAGIVGLFNRLSK